MSGKEIRLSRLMHPRSGRVFIIPMDHGVSTWPLDGLEDMEAAIGRVAVTGVTGVLIHKGQVRRAVAPLAAHRHLGLVVQLSGATCLGPDENDKRRIGSVEHALSLGADAVSVQVNMGTAGEPGMLEELGRISEACHAWGVPLLAMVYVRGAAAEKGWAPVAHAARIAAELGADLVKTSYTGSIDTFQRVVEGAGIPVIIGGGPRIDSDLRLLETLQDALRAGASGACIGRNVFQHDDPTAIVESAARVIHEGTDAGSALRLLESTVRLSQGSRGSGSVARGL
jgi:class I fructose-bisphosphate aldolase